jgi:hypothetical protein
MLISSSGSERVGSSDGTVLSRFPLRSLRATRDGPQEWSHLPELRGLQAIIALCRPILVT